MASRDKQGAADGGRPRPRHDGDAMPAPGSGLHGIDKVFVASVKSFSDRISHMKQELGKHGILFECVFDFDVPDLRNEDLARFDSGRLTLPEQSLVLKHIAVWQRMASEGLHRALVFEDDALLSHDFRDAMRDIIDAADALPPGYLIFLGGADTRLPKGFLNYPAALIPRRMTTAEGFIMDVDAARRRLAWLDGHTVNLPADALMRRMDEAVGVPHFWPRRPIVEQASCTGRFASTLDGSRARRTLTAIQLRYRWRKFKNQRLIRWMHKQFAAFSHRRP